MALEPGYPVADQLGEEGVEVGEVTMQDALGAAGLVVTARLVSAFGPSRSKTRSAASNSWSPASLSATPVGKV